jgi:hypothetical protein
MDLATAAGFFDALLCVDTFSPVHTFYAQLDVFDDSRRDGTTVARRVLSVEPGTRIPPKRVITIGAEKWLVGMSESDYFMGDAVRQKYILHRADGAAVIQRAEQLVTSGGASTYAAAVWIKDMKEAEESSRFQGFYNVYLPSSETVIEGDLITLNNEYYRARNAFLSTAGFLVAESDRLPADLVASAVYTQSVYDPVTESFSGGVATTISLIVLRWQTNYEYGSASAEKYAPGDVHGVVAKAALPAPARAGNVVVFASRTWEVISVDDEGTSWGLHLRPKGT